MKKNFIIILLILSVIVFNIADLMYAASEDTIQIGQYDGINAGNKSTYPDDFDTYTVDSYGIVAVPPYIRDITYENEPVLPDIYIYDEKNEKRLRENTDYKVRYIDNDEPGTAYMIIEGMGNYEGEVVFPFHIIDDRDNKESGSYYEESKSNNNENKSDNGGYKLNNKESEDEDEEDEEDETPKSRRKKSKFKPYERIIQTTLPITPKPSYPPAVPIKITPTPTVKPTLEPTQTPKPTRMPERKPYVDIFNHNRFMGEYTAGEFGVDMYVSKAETAVIFSGILMDKYDSGTEYPVIYEDVSPDSPFKNYIGFISQYGIMDEDSENEFYPNKMMTRADFAVILSKFTEDKGYSDFIDVPRDYWAKEYIDKAAAQGWMTGTSDGRFMPDKYITRGEIAKILVTFLDRDIEATLKIENLPQFSDVPPEHWAYPYVMAAATYR